MNNGVNRVKEFELDENSRNRGTDIKEHELDKPTPVLEAIPFELLKNKLPISKEDTHALDENKLDVKEDKDPDLDKNKSNAKSSINDEEKIKYNRYDKFNE